MPERIRTTVTTAADGSATAYVGTGLNGCVASITYTKTDYAAGVDFAITVESTGESLWTQNDVNASATVYPVQKGNLGGTGTASTITEVPMFVANDRVKIVIASGGNAKVGTFDVVIA